MEQRRPKEGAAWPPDPPKRYKSSYICFSVANRDQVKAELGEDCSLSDISKRMAQKWKALTSEERKKWDNAAKEDRTRYEEEMANYTGPLKTTRRRSPKKKDPSAPKRPMSAFLFFSKKYRPTVTAQHPDMKNRDVCKRLGEMWRAASEDERNVYIQHEETQRAKYKIDMGKWKKQQAKEGAKKKSSIKEARFEKAKERREKKRRAEEEEATKRESGGLIEVDEGEKGQSKHSSSHTRQYAGVARESYGAYHGGSLGHDFGAQSSYGGDAASSHARRYVGDTSEAYEPHYGTRHGQLFHTPRSYEVVAPSAQGPARHDPLYAYLQSQYRSSAELDMILQPPFLERPYGTLGGMGASPGAEPIRAGLGGFGQESYLRGLYDYQRLHSSGVPLSAVGMSRALQGHSADAAFLYGYGRPGETSFPVWICE